MSSAGTGRLSWIGGLLALAVATLGAAADQTVKSEWKSHDVAIDGRLDEWGTLTNIEEGPSVAATNDAEFLYLVVTTTDAPARSALARGLVLWIDPTGKKKMDFGVRWPATVVGGVSGTEAPALGPAALEELDFLSAGNVRRLVTLTPEIGVAAASGTLDRTLAFELKLPLVSNATHPYAVGAAAGRSIEIGLFLPDLPKEARRDDRQEPVDPRTVGIGPLFGGPTSGMPLPDSSRKTKVEKPFVMKVWATVQLAGRS